MNFDTHSSSGGDGRRPPRYTYDLGLHKEAPKKSKKRHHRQNRTAYPPAAAAAAEAPFTPPATAPTPGAVGGVMDDNDAFFCATLVAAMNAAEDTIAHMAQQNAQAVANQSLAAQALAAQAMATPARVARDAASRSASRSSASSTPLPPSGVHPPASSSAGASSSRTNAAFHCPHCHRPYSSHQGVADHVRRVHASGGFRYCSRCRFVSDDREAFRAHMRAHGRRYVCPLCGERNNLSAHAQHLYSCPASATFRGGPAASLAQAAPAAQHATSATQVPHSGAHPSASSSVGASSSRSEPILRCPYCHRTHSSLQTLRNHVRRTHETGGSHLCHRCRFVSDDSEAFRAHLRTHERRRQCHWCGQKPPLSEYAAHMANCLR